MSKDKPSPTVSKPRRLGRKLAIAAAILTVVLVGGWLVVTSAAFFKGVILPRVGASMNAEVSVSDATIQPFKQVVLHDFTLQARGEETFFSAAEIRCRYSLFDILGGTLTVDEAILKSPRIHYIQKPDGTSNLGPLLQAATGNEPASPKTASKPSGPLRTNIRRVAIENAAILYTATDTAGNRTSVELDDASLVLADLRNGGDGSLELGATLKASLTSAATNALLLANIAGKFNVSLDANAAPTFVQGGTTFTVTDARGGLADMAGFATALDCQMSAAEIQNFSLKARRGSEELAQLRVSGPFDPAKGEARLAVELFGVDRRLLNMAGGPFGLDFGQSVVASTNTLVLRQQGTEITLTGQFLANEFAVTQNGHATPPVQISSDYDLTVRPSVTLTAGLVAHLKELNAFMPGSSLPDETLKAQVSLGAAMTNQVATVDKATLTLSPTPRAKNELMATGSIDLSDMNAISGHLKLAAETLDLTQYYELFERMKPTSDEEGTLATGSSPDETEPDAMRLPLKDFVTEFTIDHLYLRDVEIANWQASMRLDGGRVSLKPCRLMLNGAPVHAELDLDLAVPGWTYQFEGGMDSVPLAPLVDSFVPDRKGQFAGSANAAVQVRGAGVTGASLQKHLAGQFDLGATNLNFALDNARSKLVRKLSEVLFTLPDLVRNPSGAVAGKLLGAVLGGNKAVDSGGWSGQIKGSPVDSLALRGTADKGTVRIEEAFAQSRAYLARTSGEVLLAPVLMNSTLRFPVELSLSRELAAQTGLLPSNTPTNAVYAKLPDFLTLQGSAGDPKSKINYVALAMLASQSGSSLTGGTGNKDLDKVSGTISALGNLLGGESTARTNAPVEGATTNATEQSPNKLLDLFNRKSH